MMESVVPFMPDRFRNAAKHYLAGRPTYSSNLIRRLVQLCGVGIRDRIMDLGCGPAPLAVALAPFVHSVLAVDPSPEMLEEAAANAARAGVHIDLQMGSSYDLNATFGLFRLVVMGRSFHWMDRQQTLAHLDRLVEADGAIALCSARSADLPENTWRVAYEEIIERISRRDTIRDKRKSADWVRDETLLMNSPFCCLERIVILERRETPVERFVDRLFSMSSTTPEEGAAAEALAAEVRSTLAPFAVCGVISEAVESAALIARRPE